ncbi:high choriolytic enzyme 1 isoform X1 [Cottoperca gobio]|uniref:Metalloendopeptidase n=1 Tax=Cottoperca gobio TaxID=56716 RepID=A0A6J2QVL5_COTGO|nr:high choriolytic enzyme 1-like isoform X1 [Cottoperca gobio]
MLLLAALLFVQSLKHVDSSPLPDAEHGSQGDWLGRVLHYMESNPETVEELMTKKYGVSEGDMVLSTDRNAVKTIWLSPAIPYVISPELESRTGDILAAMAMLSKPTCVSFHKRTYETDYLYFIKSKGCASYVGFMGGVQTVFIAPECIVGNIAHELIHALGFHHEHTRTDREDYVTVLQENIMEVNSFQPTGCPPSYPKLTSRRWGRELNCPRRTSRRFAFATTARPPKNQTGVESDANMQEEASGTSASTCRPAATRGRNTR